MPYIKKEIREELTNEIDALAKKIISIHKMNQGQSKDGLINFSLTELLLQVYNKKKYHEFNELIGALECCKLEMYRKFIGPYEDLKELENGSVRNFFNTENEKIY